MNPWAIVAPASRGIGRAVAREILQTTSCSVVATARRKPDDVKRTILSDLNVEPSRLYVLTMDFLGNYGSSSMHAIVDFVR